MPQSTRIIFYTRRKKAMLLRNKPRAQADPQNRTTNAHVNRLVVLLHLVASLSCLLVNQLGQLLNLARLLLIFHPLSLKNLLQECIVSSFSNSSTPLPRGEGCASRQHQHQTAGRGRPVVNGEDPKGSAKEVKKSQGIKRE